MKLQMSSRLAILALLELAAHPDEQVAVAAIGGKYRISAHHLAKVMNTLSRAGLVRSSRGAAGGYQFSGNPRRVTLLDVIELFEDLGANDGKGAGATATDEVQALSKLLGEIDDIARATLGSVTIATMLKLVERRRSTRRRPAAASDS
jgi:Rrf2 family protein